MTVETLPGAPGANVPSVNRHGASTGMKPPKRTLQFPLPCALCPWPTPTSPTLTLGCGCILCDRLALPDMDALQWTVDLCDQKNRKGGWQRHEQRSRRAVEITLNGPMCNLFGLQKVGVPKDCGSGVWPVWPGILNGHHPRNALWIRSQNGASSTSQLPHMRARAKP